MTESKILPTLPENIRNLIDKACVQEPASPGRPQRIIGVTPEICQEAQQLAASDVTLLCDMVLDNRLWTEHEVEYVTKSLIVCLGERSVPSLSESFLRYEQDHTKHLIIQLLGEIGVPGLNCLNDIFGGLTSAWLVQECVRAFFVIGNPAAKSIAMALEHPEVASARLVLKRIQYDEKGQNISVDLANDLANAIVNELIIRSSVRPNTFNDAVVAECLAILFERNPQLRRPIQEQLRDLAFQPDMQVRERAVQVAKKIDVDDFLHQVRLKASTEPEVAGEILRQLGVVEVTPSQTKSLAQYTKQLEALEQRSLER